MSKRSRINQPAVTFDEILEQQARFRAEAPAFVFLDGNGKENDGLTFGALHRRVRAIAAAVQSVGVAGRTVLLVFPPGLDFVAALFACFRAGVIAVPVPFTAGRRTENRVGAICRDARPAVVLSVSHFPALDKLRALLADCGQSPEWLMTDRLPDAAAPPAVVAADDVALLQYTSGSTGTPKGVMLSHRNLLANSAMVAAAFGHDHHSRGVGWLPLFHDMGLVGHVLQPVFVGGLSVLMSPFTFIQRPRLWLEAISFWRANTGGGPSSGYALALRALDEALPPTLDLSSWTVAYCGAEKVRHDILGAFAARLSGHGFAPAALHPCYGLAEATLLVTAVGRSAGGGGGGGCGHAWEGCQVDIVDPERGEPVADGTVGEIRVRGPHVGHGYWNRPEESAAAFRTDAAGRALWTGDLGVLNGAALTVVGRIKDTIIAFGAKHAAEDIEATVAHSDPAFARLPCAAFALETGDREAVVVVQEVPSGTDAATLAEAARRASAAVTGEHGLKLTDFRLVRRGRLPCTTSGKVQRSRARAMYAEGQLPPLHAAAEPPR